MKKLTGFCTFLLVSALFCSSAFALAPLAVFSPKSSASEAVEPVESVVESKETSTISVETPTVSETSSTGSEASAIDEILEAIEKSGAFMLPGQLKALKEELKAELTAVADDFDAHINQLEADLQKEKYGSKFFADLGLAFGLKDAVQFGFCGDIGMRFGKGLMFKVGGQYMVGDTREVIGILGHNWSLANATVQTTIGWEW